MELIHQICCGGGVEGNLSSHLSNVQESIRQVKQEASAIHRMNENFDQQCK